LDSTDGVTPETGLTIAQADMQLSKDGAAFAQKNASGNATHDTDGWYSTTLNTTDTGTTGVIELQINVTGALPVWKTFFILTGTAYDSLQTGTFNNISPAEVNTQCDTALTDYDGPTNTEMEARTIVSANYATASSITALNDFDPTSDAVANVTLVATTTTNTDMRGTDSALLASSYTAPDNATISSIETKVDNIPTVTEFNARTLPSADYSQFDYTVDEVSADTVKVNGATVLGAGTAANLWRGN